jgi:L-arabinokinase
MSKSVLFYISGHGFGHTTREIEIMKTLIRLEPTVRIFVKTDAPAWFFHLNLPAEYVTLNSESCDVGVVQNDSFRADRRTTLQHFSQFYLNFKKTVPRELHWIQENKIDLIVGDIPPLAFEVSRAANLPGIAVANFSWDWIYEPYVNDTPELAWVVPVLKMLYGKADALLRLPLHGDLSAFPNPHDISFIARKATLPREEVRRKLLPKNKRDKKIGLISLRSGDLEKIDLPHLKKLNDFEFFVFTERADSSNLHSLPPDFLPYQELVHAADVVISKPGYGIVSECLANRTPLLFTNREDFREYEVLAAGILDMGLGVFLPQSDFFAGHWEEALQVLPDLRSGWRQPKVTGAEEAAAFLLKFLQ